MDRDVELRIGESAPIRVHTDAAGSAMFPVSTDPRRQISLRVEGFEAYDLSKGAGTSASEIVLQSVGCIEGRVQSESPDLIPTQIQVVAIPGNAPLHVVERSAISDASRVTQCNPDGSFRIPCLSDAQQYSLIAGGAGWIATKPETETWPFVAGGQTGTVLNLKRLYMGMIDSVDSDGKPMKIPKRGSFAGSCRTWSEVPGTIASSEVYAEHQLAGYLPEWDSLPQGRILRMFIANSSGPTLGPNGIHAAFPGYAPLDVAFWAASVEVRPLMITSVTCNPTAESWGTVTLRFTSGANKPIRGEDCPEGKLMLEPEKGKSLSFGVTARKEEVDIENIPVGIYRASFVPRIRGGAFPPRSEDRPLLHVGEANQIFEVPMNLFGNLVVHFINADGTEYTGEVSFILSAAQRDSERGTIARGKNVRVGSIDKAPLELRGVRTGTYVLRCLNPSQADEGPAGLEKETVLELDSDTPAFNLRVLPPK